MKVFSIIETNDSFIIEKTIAKKNINTNEPFLETLFYTDKFIKKNKKIISEILNSKNITNAVYKDFESFLLISPILNSTNIKFEVNRALSIKVMDSILNNNSVRVLECYFMPSDYVHKLANKNISIKFNNEMKFTPKFVEYNGFKNLKSIYYKKFINFYSREEVFNNFEEFLKVNSSLKLIHLYYYSDEVMDFIVDKLEKYNVSSSIFIHMNEDNKEVISRSSAYLKKLNKKYSIKGNKEIKIIYSNEFFNNNIFRELTLNGLKLSMVIILYIGFIFMISNQYHEYVALLNLRLLENSLANSGEIGESIDEIDDENVNQEVVDTPVEPSNPEGDGEKVYVNRYANIPTTFDKLLSINDDVVGWVSVNNTKANYPVTQYTDNSYYLEHDIYKKKITTGWIFMDYRNDSVLLDKNTIIYGHNLKTGYMFGDLKNTTKKEWYTNIENQTIIFNTLEKEMKWQIISMYKTDYTTDYLKTSFYNDAEFMEFVTMIKERSIYNFNVNVDVSDKILTLSTCTGSNNRRLVIHAVMISE